MPKFPPRDHADPRQKKPYSQRPPPPGARRGPKPPPSAPVISKAHKEQQQSQQSQSLDLTGQALTEPPALAKEYPRLGKLNLTDCSLTSISFVSQVKHTLTWLNLSGNKLRDKSAWEGIDQLKTLYVLNASHCELTEVPQCVSSLQSLKALVLSHNSLTTLEHIRNLPDLNTIVVSNNQLTSLPSTLTSLPSLKKISASHNNLTPSGLPNLSSLSHLSELRFSHNPNLTSLPQHFGGWGKQPLPAGEANEQSDNDARRGRRGGGGGAVSKRQGVEILDLSSCGFENWYGLRAIAEQDGIVNLGLKGNKVAQDAMGTGEAASDGFEQFKSKLTILLPNLRILDSIRFDAKHFELKTLRASRTPEQALLDAGPMALEILAKKSKEDKEKIELEKVEAILKEREREKENKRRRRKGLEELGDGSRRKEREDRLKREREEQGAEPGDAAVAEPAATKGEEPPTKKKRKDSKKGKGVKDPSTPTDTSRSEPAEKAVKKREKRVKSHGGVLDALKADPTEAKNLTAVQEKKLEPATEEAEKKEEKQKTSVLKVIEVKKSKDKGKGNRAGAVDDEGDSGSKADVGELLGLGKKKQSVDEEKSGGVFDMLGGSSNTGVFGGGGWD